MVVLSGEIERAGGDHPRLLVAAGILISLGLTLTLLPQNTFDPLVREDGAVESIGAASLLVAALIFGAGFLRSRTAIGPGWRRRLLPWAFVCLSALFLFAAGEEISWGQRIFGWETPEALNEANGQNETNLHNLGPVHEGSWWLRTNAIFAYFWLTFAVVVPVAVFLSDRVKRQLQGRIPILPVLMAPLFFFNQVASEAVERGLPASLYHGTAQISTTVTEIRETNFGLLFAIAAYLTVAGLDSRRFAREVDRASPHRNDQDAPIAA